MESSEDLDLINLAIQKLIKEKRIKDTSGNKLSEDDEQLLSRLLSQESEQDLQIRNEPQTRSHSFQTPLESLKGDTKLKQSEVEEVTSPRVDKAETKSESGSQVGSRCGEIGVEEIVKELKAVKRQNTITHCLMSVLIVVTVTWQFSEMSLFLKVKDGLSHPFRSFGNMLMGMLPSPRNGINNTINNTHDAIDKQNQLRQMIQDSSLPSVKIPDLPHVE